MYVQLLYLVTIRVPKVPSEIIGKTKLTYWSNVGVEGDTEVNDKEPKLQ